MKVLTGFLLGVVVAVIGMWAFAEWSQPDPTVQTTEDSSEPGGLKQDLREAGQVIKDASSDAVISTKIKAKLAADDTVPAMRIDVDTTDGLVTLSGKVQSESVAAQAVEIARSVDGVKEVVSTLQIASIP